MSLEKLHHRLDMKYYFSLESEKAQELIQEFKKDLFSAYGWDNHPKANEVYNMACKLSGYGIGSTIYHNTIQVEFKRLTSLINDCTRHNTRSTQYSFRPSRG